MLEVDDSKLQNIKIAFNIINSIKKEALKNKEYCFEKSLEEFALHLSILPSQMYGCRIENKLSKYLELENSNDKNRGDRVSKNNRYIEIKGSFNSDILNLVQIRPWQDISEYVIYFWNFDSNFKLKDYYFHLSVKEMNNELDLLNAGNAHGTKEANYSNKNKELALHIDKKSKHFLRWIKNYYIDLDTLKSLINDC